MRLIEDAKWVLARAWSVKLIALAAFLSGAEVALQVAIAFEIQPPIPAGVFALVAGLVTVAAFAARFIAQCRTGDE